MHRNVCTAHTTILYNKYNCYVLTVLNIHNSDKSIVTKEKDTYFLHNNYALMVFLILFWLIPLLNSWPLCLHSTSILDFINSSYKYSVTRLQMGTSRHTGQHPLSCPQSYWPWTWPQFRYTYGCCFSFTASLLILEVNLRGITSVFSSTGHCGWPAFNSSTSVSKWHLVWKTGIVSFIYNFFTLFNAIPMKIWYTRVRTASLALVNTVPVANVWTLKCGAFLTYWTIMS